MNKYSIRKAEKIVSALYLVSSIIKDDDSMKWRIREESVSFISTVLIFCSAIPIERDHALQSLTSSANSLSSLLRVSSDSGLISKMNISIIIPEIDSFIEFIQKDSTENQPTGYVLSNSFFGNDLAESSALSIYKGHDKRRDETLKTQNSNKSHVMDIKGKKNSRQQNIINLLRKNSNLTIKDFGKIITDCSEKTIQRELMSLVEKGVIKREGERRWSTYSLI